MKTSIVSINLFIGVLSSFLFFSIVSISNAYAAISDFNFAAVGDWGCNSNTDATVKGMTRKLNKHPCVRFGRLFLSTNSKLLAQ